VAPDQAPGEQMRPQSGLGVGGRVDKHDDVDVGIHPSNVSGPGSDDHHTTDVIVCSRPPIDLLHNGSDFLTSLLRHHGASLTRRKTPRTTTHRRAGSKALPHTHTA
jgi:hypothetical protein